MSLQDDAHPEDIKAELAKKGISLRALSVGNGYHRSAVSKALRQPWPQVERLIAKALGRHAQDIWPSRYLPDGQSKFERASQKGSTGRAPRNVQKSKAA